jgi:D-beta-D-heptose 7-phosphate kinase / D-beta-D-heptose 1-phosphate adenosyltransferase
VIGASRSNGARGRRPLVVVGDALLDRDVDGSVERISPEAPVPVVDDPTMRARPGGAALAAGLAASDGRDVVLVTALAGDRGAEELLPGLEHQGVEVVDLGRTEPTPEKLRVRADGRTLLRVDRNCRPSRINGFGAEAREAIRSAAAVLVSDYGYGVAADPRLRRELERVPASVPLVWDPHQRGPHPVAGVLLATPNRAEGKAFALDVEGDDLAAETRRARALAERWGAVNVCITLGADGVLLVGGPGPPLAVPAPPVVGGDPCGAGDRFASLVTGLLADGALVRDAVSAAVAPASAFVARGGAAAVRGDDGYLSVNGTGGAEELAERVRTAGGTVVATGGCFDILHAGHAHMLRAARALGDCLIVCLNSDDSVGRLKGPGRPIVRAEDRVAILSALRCVDAVVVFDEDTPEQVLELIQPDIFAKGGDYAASDIPEGRALEHWGGQVVILPYVPDRSTTRLIEEAAYRAG